MKIDMPCSNPFQTTVLVSNFCTQTKAQFLDMGPLDARAAVPGIVRNDSCAGAVCLICSQTVTDRRRMCGGENEQQKTAKIKVTSSREEAFAICIASMTCNTLIYPDDDRFKPHTQRAYAVASGKAVSQSFEFRCSRSGFSPGEH